MNIREIIKICWMALLFISCDSEDAYAPFHASVLDNGVLLSCVDSSGNDLLSDEDFIKQITIYGVLSKREIPFEVKKVEYNGTERCCLSFNAELPDEKSMRFDGDNEATGASTVNLSINKHDLKLSFSFKYSCSNSENYGGSMMTIEAVTYDNQKVERRENHLVNSDFLLCMERNDGGFTLKD